MERVSRDHLRLVLSIALKLYRRSEKKAFGIESETVLNKMVEDILTRVMGKPENESVILRPSRINRQIGEREGHWGGDEPHPLDVLPAGTITHVV